MESKGNLRSQIIFLVKSHPTLSVMWLPPKSQTKNESMISMLDETRIEDSFLSQSSERKEINFLFSFLSHYGSERSSLLYYLLYIIPSSGHRWKDYLLWWTAIESSPPSFGYDEKGKKKELGKSLLSQSLAKSCFAIWGWNFAHCLHFPHFFSFNILPLPMLNFDWENRCVFY